MKEIEKTENGIVKITKSNFHELVNMAERRDDAEIKERDGHHRPCESGCGCIPADGNVGAYRDVKVKIADKTVRFYHQAPVVITGYSRGRRLMRLDSCGYNTRTTKQRINRELQKAGKRVTQTDYDWYVKDIIGGELRQFEDGMEIRA